MSNENDNMQNNFTGAQSKTPAEKIGPLAMQVIEYVEDKYGDDAWIGSAMIVVDVIASAPGGGYVNPIVTLCNDPRKWVALALLEEGVEQAREANGARVLEAEDAAADDD